MKKCLIILLILPSITSLFFSAFKSSNNKNKTPGAYDLNNPAKSIMTASHLEIPGFCFYKGKPDTIFAIQDEDGKFFRTILGKKDVYHTKPAGKGDYEDVAVTGEKAGYVLKFPLQKPG